MPAGPTNSGIAKSIRGAGGAAFMASTRPARSSTRAAFPGSARASLSRTTAAGWSRRPWSSRGGGGEEAMCDVSFRTVFFSRDGEAFDFLC